jgi:hypothetical protein
MQPCGQLDLRPERLVRENRPDSIEAVAAASSRELWKQQLTTQGRCHRKANALGCSVMPGWTYAFFGRTYNTRL